MKSIEMKGFVLPSNANAAFVNNTLARIAIIYDKQPSGVFPSPSDIFSDVNYSGTATFDVLSVVNLSNRDRFTILKDKVLYLPPLGINGSTPAKAQNVNANVDSDPSINGSFNIKCFIKLGDLGTQYRASSNPPLIGDISSGALYLFCMSSADPNASTAWILDCKWRIRYSDQ